MTNIEQLYDIAYDWHISTHVLITRQNTCNFEDVQHIPTHYLSIPVSSFRFEPDDTIHIFI